MNTLSDEFFPPHWQRMNEHDAHFLGRLSVLGIAMPNAPELSVPALQVADIASPITRREIDRLVAAAEGVASIPGTSFAGLAHSQLAVTELAPAPLQIFLAPAQIRGLPTETTIGGLAFQALVNTQISLPTIVNAGQLAATKEGCFSSGPVFVATHRPKIIKRLRTHRSDGEPLTVTDFGGFEAIIVQHESDHGEGVRAADIPNIHRNWIPKDSVEESRKLAVGDYDQWPQHCTEEQWQAYSRDPYYPFFPTEALREAYEAGAEAQRAAMNR